MADTVRAAIYARISRDSAGEELGVTRQLDLARDLINSRGWTESEAYSDNSISALTGKHRPGYSALCEAIGRGEVDRVVVYHLSRLWRNRRERAEGIELFKDARVSITAVHGSDIDMQSAAGRTMVGLLGEFDTLESETKSERIRDQKAQEAAAGLYAGGGFRPLGYEFCTDERGRRSIRPHPEEAPIVQEAARRVLAGESLRSVARDLAHRGVRSTRGNEIRPEHLRKIMAAAVISGRREVFDRSGTTRPLLGEIVADGRWEGLISPEDSDKLRRLLSTPERRKNTPQARKTLLTGILVCGRCGTPMVSRPSSGRPRYICNPGTGRGGCGRCHLHRPKTDALIRDQVINLLAENGPEIVDRLQREAGTDPDLIDRVRADEQRLEDLTVDYNDPEFGMTRAEYVAGRKAILARLEADRTRLETGRDGDRARLLAEFVGDGSTAYERDAGMRQRWEAMADAQRRPVLLTVIEKIVVGPSTRPNRFDPFRFAVQWHDER